MAEKMQTCNWLKQSKSTQLKTNHWFWATNLNPEQLNEADEEQKLVFLSSGQLLSVQLRRQESWQEVNETAIATRQSHGVHLLYFSCSIHIFWPVSYCFFQGCALSLCSGT